MSTFSIYVTPQSVRISHSIDSFSSAETNDVKLLKNKIKKIIKDFCTLYIINCRGNRISNFVVNGY